VSGEDDEDDTQDGKRLTMGERVRLLERDTRAHARSLTEIVKTVASQGDDLKKLEEWRMTRLIAEAHEEERDKALYGRLDQIDASIKAMRGVWTKIAWIAAVPVVTAVVVGVGVMIVNAAKSGGLG
jgi:hypothetical protein